MAKKLLLTFFSLTYLAVYSQSIAANKLVAQWEYDYSLDSTEGHWSSYLENYADDIESYNSLGSDSLQSFYSQNDFDYPLLILDKKYTLRISPLGGNVLKINFLEYPQDNSAQYTYIDRTNGFTRAELVGSDNNLYLKIFNDSKNKNYKLISFNENSFTLLDEVLNLKHIFKRK